MKKILKIVGIIILFIVVIFAIFSVVYNEYIKYLIKQEEKRIESYKGDKFVLDDEYKVSISYSPATVDTSHFTTYDINFKNNTIQVFNYSENDMPIPYNKFVLWGENKAELEQLRTKQYRMETIKIDDNNKRELENLIETVLDKNKTVEEYNEEHKSTIPKSPYELANPSTYLVSTMNKTKVVMDNPEQITLFFEIIEKNHSVVEKAINGY